MKTQVAGPWTLTAGVELRTGHRVLTDRGAVAEFTASLAEGLRAHVDELARRTGAPVVVQIDEPTLPAVLAGSLPTPSGYGTVRTVPGAEARAGLAELVAAARDAGASAGRRALLPPHAAAGAARRGGGGRRRRRPRGAGRGRSRRPSSTPSASSGRRAPSSGWGRCPAPVRAACPASWATSHAPALELADRLGFDRARLADRAVVTPACGLAGASPAAAQAAMARAVELARAFADPPASW